jgi:hypothetical protein
MFVGATSAAAVNAMLAGPVGSTAAAALPPLLLDAAAPAAAVALAAAAAMTAACTACMQLVSVLLAASMGPATTPRQTQVIVARLVFTSANAHKYANHCCRPHSQTPAMAAPR